MAWWRRSPSTPAWRGTAVPTSRWMESTYEVARWESARKAGSTWAWWGGIVGGVWGLLACAPAQWLASAVWLASGQHVMLAEAQGTVWRGDAVVVLQGGSGSRDARALPGRLNWQLGWSGWGAQVRIQQDCCVPRPLALHVQPGWGKVQARVALAEPAAGMAPWGQWPAAWLSGLGTPWNTLELGGVLRLAGQDVQLTWVHGRIQMAGQLHVQLDDVSSRVTTLSRLGSYRLDMQGDGQGTWQMALRTVDGALRLQGDGSVGPSGLRFAGEAWAEPAEQGALDNLLNIIGRRAGDRSVISIG